MWQLLHETMKERDEVLRQKYEALREKTVSRTACHCLNARNKALEEDRKRSWLLNVALLGILVAFMFSFALREQ